MRSVMKRDWKLIKYDTMEGTVRKTQLFNLKDNPEELLLEHQQKDVIAKTGNSPSKNQVNLAVIKNTQKLQEMESLLFKEINACRIPIDYGINPKID